MNRYAFYFAVLFLAFGIGVAFVYFYFYKPPPILEQSIKSMEEKDFQISTDTPSKLEEPNGRTPSLTNKESALLLYKPTIDKWLRGEKLENTIDRSPDIIQEISEMKLGYYEEQFLLKSAQKTYKPSLIDVNSDGKNELVIIEKGDSYNLFDFWILEKKQTDFEVILFYYESIEKFKLLKSKNKGHFDIETSSGYSDDEPAIGKDIFKFDGKRYSHFGCFSYTYRYKDKHGKWNKLKKPILEKLDDCC